MPVVVGTGGQVTVVQPPGTIAGGYPTAQWFSPDGSVWDMTPTSGQPSGIATLAGVAGIGAAPRTITSRALATGGTLGRWSVVGERLVTWPVLVYADDPTDCLNLWRAFVRSWTATTPAAGVPRDGLLRVLRADGTWRQLACSYLAGLEQTDDPGYGLTAQLAVLSLVARDPWWYGPSQVALSFAYTAIRNYLAPYETVSPTHTTGAQALTIDGDVDASPTWTLTGPAASYTVGVPGRTFTFGALAAGEKVVVNVGRRTVTDGTGANRFGGLTLPGSQLFTLPAGVNRLTVDLTGAQPGAAVDLTYQPRYESA